MKWDRLGGKKAYDIWTLSCGTGNGCVYGKISICFSDVDKLLLPKCYRHHSCKQLFINADFKFFENDSFHLLPDWRLVVAGFLCLTDFKEVIPGQFHDSFLFYDISYLRNSQFWCNADVNFEFLALKYVLR